MTRERPILFSGEMVRALLDGRKVQTRRALKVDRSGAIAKVRLRDSRPATMLYLDFDGVPGLSWRPHGGAPTQPYPSPEDACPHGAPGERLWVKERANYEVIPSRGVMVHYPADGARRIAEGPGPEVMVSSWKRRKQPGMLMPYWASRITLELTAVRVERLQRISREDIEAEGFPLEPRLSDVTARDRFARGWDELNGKRALWAAGPWVWVLTFRRVKPT